MPTSTTIDAGHPPGASPRTSSRLHRAVALASFTLLGATVGITGPQASAASSTGAWVPAASMSTPRDYHAATKLNDGRVLVTGSSAPGVGGVFAEIYDPADNGWQNVGTDNTLLLDMTLTTLDDGRVLRAGGRITTSFAYRSSSILDPATGIWTPAGSTAVGHYYHAAVKLADGRVLIAGGEGNTSGPGVGSAYTAAVFDPATGLWTATPPMNAFRSRPTAALLPDGRALVVGGGSAEVYDPATNSWTPTGPLGSATGGVNHAMTVLADGRVLSVGGSIGTDGVTDTAIYDPATNQWTPAARMVEGRSFHTATLLNDGRVLVAGGHQVGPNWHSELYDPATNTWTAGPDLNRRRDLHTATLLDDGRVLVAGTALATDADRRSAEIFDPSASPAPPVPWNLTVRTFVQKRTNRATLTWNAQPNTTSYSIYFNGTYQGATTNTTFTHNTGLRGRLTATYLVCANRPVPCESVTATW